MIDWLIGWTTKGASHWRMQRKCAGVNRKLLWSCWHLIGCHQCPAARAGESTVRNIVKLLVIGLDFHICSLIKSACSVLLNYFFSKRWCILLSTNNLHNICSPVTLLAGAAQHLVPSGVTQGSHLIPLTFFASLSGVYSTKSFLFHSTCKLFFFTHKKEKGDPPRVEHLLTMAQMTDQ